MSLASAATYAFVAAAAGQRDDGARCRSDRRFDGFDISCSVADAAAAPSFASARRREAALPAQTVTAALCNLRSVSQWVRRVYIPHPRRETDRPLSSPATAVCIPHVCESRPHATRCACAVHGMKCGWRAARVSALHRDRRQFRGKVGSDGFEKVLIGTRGARETFLQGRKGRAAKNSVNGTGHTGPSEFCATSI